MAVYELEIYRNAWNIYIADSVGGTVKIFRDKEGRTSHAQVHALFANTPTATNTSMSTMHTITAIHFVICRCLHAGLGSSCSTVINESSPMSHREVIQRCTGGRILQSPPKDDDGGNGGDDGGGHARI